MEGKNDDKKVETKDIKEKDSIQEEIPYSCIPRLEDKYKDLSYDR